MGVYTSTCRRESEQLFLFIYVYIYMYVYTIYPFYILQKYVQLCFNYVHLTELLLDVVLSLN